MSAPMVTLDAPLALARLRLHLELGRISNLPTVWSNVLAAAVLSGATLTSGSLVLGMLGFSALYIGGMYLNDACDAAIDTRERTERPIPSGRITQRAVALGALSWFAIGVSMIGGARALSPAADGSVSWLPATLALLACIVLYDRHHKGNRYGPLLMAGCRALVYVAAASTLSGNLTPTIGVGALLSFAWVAGLTAFAKQESRPRSGSSNWPLLVLTMPVLAAMPVLFDGALVPVLCVTLLLVVHRARFWMRRRAAGDFPAAIGLLIAAISIVDAIAIARTGHVIPSLVAVSCAVLTLSLQRRIAGT